MKQISLYVTFNVKAYLCYKMFKQGLSILFTVLTLQGVGQNLVPNGSFEDHTACPSNPGEIYLAPPWFQPLEVGPSTSDYYNVCALDPQFGVPINNVGNQLAKTGEGYSGILFWQAGQDLREYIEVELLSSLSAGKTYCVEFYVSLADTSTYGINNLGAYFSTDSIMYTPPFGDMVLHYNPQVNNSTGTIINKNEWVLVSGQFVANGGERFMTIGNFFSNANTIIQPAGGSLPFDLAYYYIDDVSVTCCDPSGTCTLSLPEPPAIPFSIPTLLSTNDVFYIKGADAPVNLTLYDARGRLVYKNEQYINDLPLVSYAEGIYFYVINLSDGKTERGKLVIGK